MTMRESHPKHRISSVLSVVVMVSAFLLLFAQKSSWTEAFAFNGSAYVLTEGSDLFTNGYRYLNWLIDVPMLLIQILFVATLTALNRSSYMLQFFVSGPLMIVTGYIGQFYEPGRLSESMFLWVFWGLVSTGFFVHVLYLITRVIREGKSNMDPACASSSSGRQHDGFFDLFPALELLGRTPSAAQHAVEHDAVQRQDQIPVKDPDQPLRLEARRLDETRVFFVDGLDLELEGSRRQEASSPRVAADASWAGSARNR